METLVIAAPKGLKNSIDAVLASVGAGKARYVKNLALARENFGEKPEFVLLVSAHPAEEEALFLEECGRQGIACLLLTGGAEAKKAAQRLLLSRCLVLCAPLSIRELSLGVHLAVSVSCKFDGLQRQNDQLRQRLEDFKLIDRAKCCLVAILGMDEERAHRYIQKRAMDMRLSQREVAEDILKTYE